MICKYLKRNDFFAYCLSKINRGMMNFWKPKQYHSGADLADCEKLVWSNYTMLSLIVRIQKIIECKANSITTVDIFMWLVFYLLCQFSSSFVCQKLIKYEMSQSNLSYAFNNLVFFCMILTHQNLQYLSILWPICVWLMEFQDRFIQYFNARILYIWVCLVLFNVLVDDVYWSSQNWCQSICLPRRNISSKYNSQ